MGPAWEKGKTCPIPSRSLKCLERNRYSRIVNCSIVGVFAADFQIVHHQLYLFIKCEWTDDFCASSVGLVHVVLQSSRAQ